MWNEEEIKYWFLPRKDVIYSYVVENSEKIITDFVSFYCLPSSVLKHEKHKDLRAAYSYYNVSTVTPLKVTNFLLINLIFNSNFNLYIQISFMNFYNSKYFINFIKLYSYLKGFGLR